MRSLTLFVRQRTLVIAGRDNSTSMGLFLLRHNKMHRVYIEINGRRRRRREIASFFMHIYIFCCNIAGVPLCLNVYECVHSYMALPSRKSQLLDGLIGLGAEKTKERKERKKRSRHLHTDLHPNAHTALFTFLHTDLNLASFSLKINRQIAFISLVCAFSISFLALPHGLYPVNKHNFIIGHGLRVCFCIGYFRNYV